MMRRSVNARGLAGTFLSFCALSLVGGIGLASYATGGDLGRMDLAGKPETRLTANPDALVADSYARLEAGFLDPQGPVLCQDCGPGLYERRALARAAAYDAELARYDARLDAFAEPAPAALEPAPASEPLAVQDEVETSDAAFRELGELAVLPRDADTATQTLR